MCEEKNWQSLNAILRIISPCEWSHVVLGVLLQTLVFYP